MSRARYSATQSPKVCTSDCAAAFSMQHLIEASRARASVRVFTLAERSEDTPPELRDLTRTWYLPSFSFVMLIVFCSENALKKPFRSEFRIGGVLSVSFSGGRRRGRVRAPGDKSATREPPELYCNRGVRRANLSTDRLSDGSTA